MVGLVLISGFTFLITLLTNGEDFREERSLLSDNTVACYLLTLHAWKKPLQLTSALHCSPEKHAIFSLLRLLNLCVLNKYLMLMYLKGFLYSKLLTHCLFNTNYIVDCSIKVNYH